MPRDPPLILSSTRGDAFFFIRVAGVFFSVYLYVHGEEIGRERKWEIFFGVDGERRFRVIWKRVVICENRWENSNVNCLLNISREFVSKVQMHFTLGTYTLH